MSAVLKEKRIKWSVFGTELATPQNIIFNSMMNLNYAAFRLPRGGGKDFLLAVYAMQHAASTAESHISIVAPVYRQVKILFEEIERFSLKSTHFKDLRLEKSVCRLRLKNGSIIEAMPFHIYDGDIILVTEASNMPKHRLLELIKGVESNTLKKVFLMSVGYYDYNYMSEIEAHEHFSTLAFGYKSFPIGFYDQASIDNAKKTLSADVFNMEYNSKKICK